MTAGAPSAPALSLCVYCGSRSGADPAFERAAQAMGNAIGRRGWQLVYGGGRAGLMGSLADAALAARLRRDGRFWHDAACRTRLVVWHAAARRAA